MVKTMLVKTVLLAGILVAAMPAADAQGFRGGYRGGFRGGVIIGGYYPGYYGGLYPGIGFGIPYGHPNSGQVKIDTKDKNAQVYIDGSFAGSAKDWKSAWLQQGHYDLEIRASGNGPKFTAQIYVIPGKTMHVRPEFPADAHK